MRWAWEDVVLEALNRVPSLGGEDPLGEGNGNPL